MKLSDILSIDYKENISLAGMTDELFSVYVNNLYNSDKNIVIVTSTLYEANKLYESISNYTEDVLLFPMDDFLTSEAMAISPDLMINRLEVINSLLRNKKQILVTNLMGYLRYLPSKDTYKKNVIKLKVNIEIDPKKLINDLVNSGYNRETIVTKTGEFGVRGFVVDIFPISFKNPVRIEFFGDEIESIRYFDEETQKSIENIDEIEIYPYTEFLLDEDIDVLERKQKYLNDYSKNISNISDYIEDPIFIFKDYNQMLVSYRSLEEEMLNYKTEKDVDFDGRYMSQLSLPRNVIYYDTLNNISSIKDIDTLYFDCKEIVPFNENIDVINKFLKEQKELGRTVIICLKRYQINNFIKHLDVNYVLTNENEIYKDNINIIEKTIGKGFIYKNFVILSDKDLFKISLGKKKYKSNYKYSSKIKDINKLNIGDFVVHDIHGIGTYNGITTLKNGNILKDYIVVNYEGMDKLYIPVEKIDLLSKYAGGENARVKVNKLGGSEWKKTKLRVRNKIKDIADKLLRLYAEREMKKGFMFSKDTELQYKFESLFEFDETKDQLKAVEDIKYDMESSTPMDRLLCGDVGYGKTEVAFRAMFKAVMDSKQVLYLCPTTILSNQHYKNALERFSSFPINIALLNRFTSLKEQKRILAGLEDGTIDIVFGTHRLLSNDIRPKDLGLLVIDEEQRFGVTHKEKIKEYKANVDVLTLTATPIPRTLQMSMIGIRSLSLIETPPINRYPVQTYVIEENSQIIKDAIYKEMSRGGQVFLLYNRVETIEEEVGRISRLCPDARIIYAHGQMTKTEIEDRMQSFIDYEADVLICTTIIETGIDIPNVNTLIIIDADRFGLSQLYQIRGRVGRSNKIAYAYLMYNPKKVLTESAVKRLNVIKEFTELGSGFSIATRDLSIRGAGDILGSEQAGFIDSVGIDLYLKMLNDEVMKLKGLKTKEEELKEEKPLLNVTTHIDDSYVSDVDLKIEIHKKINEIDSYETLINIKNELEDRFGKLNEDIIIYMYEEWFEKLAKEKDIVEVKQLKNSIELVFSCEATSKIDGEKIFRDAFNITPMFRFKMLRNHLIIVLDTIKLEKHYIYYLIDLLKVVEFKDN